MQPVAIIALIIIAINVAFSIQGFRQESFFERFLFRVDDVLLKKEYYRAISSGFLHIGWMHLIFNMVALYFFSSTLQMFMGVLPFVTVYFAGLIGGNLLALFIHRNHGDYSSVGASGAIAGIIFATIALFPGININLFFLPIGIPGWLFGLLYMLYTIYGVRSRRDNVGHEAHLGGALVGMYTALLFYPLAMADNFITIAIISLPAIFFIYIIITRPQALLVDNYFFNQHNNATIEDRYNMQKVMKQQEIDQILEKIHRKGINSLSKMEKEALDEYSRSN